MPIWVLRAHGGNRKPLGLAGGGWTRSQWKPANLATRVGIDAAENQRTAIRGECRLAVPEGGRLRIRQLPFLTGFGRNYKQGVGLSLALGIRDHQATAV